MLIIGIDPGISGAICFFEDGQVREILEMPTMAEGKKNKRQVNGPQIYNEIFSRITKFSKLKLIITPFLKRCFYQFRFFLHSIYCFGISWFS